MNRRALVTGASGFMGHYLCAALRARGHSVISLSRASSASADVDERIDLVDVAAEDALQSALEQARPDVIFHLAGVVNATTPAELYRVNTLFGLALARSAARLGTIPVLVVAGSVAEYGPSVAEQGPISEMAACLPRSAYGISKLAQTLHVLAEYGPSTVVARLFNPIGAAMRSHLALGSFAQQLAEIGPEGGVLRTGDLSAVRDFIDAGATANCLIDLAETSAARGQIVNVCSGRGTRLRDIVEAMIERAGKPVSLAEDARIGSQTSKGMDRVVGDPARLQGLGVAPPGLDIAALARSLAQGA